MADDGDNGEGGRGPKPRGWAGRPSKGARRVDDPKRPQPAIRVDDGTGASGPAPMDLELIADLAGIGCTFDEIAGVLRITRKAWEYRVSHDPAVRCAWEWGRAEMKETIRRHMWRHAEGNGSSAVNATQHLAKHLLGETDKAADRAAGVAEPGAFEFDPAKLKNLSTEELVTLAGLFAKLVGDGAGGGEASASPSGNLH